MGSCFSTEANSSLKNHKKLRSNLLVPPPPTPPPPEEETVKEVLSETPKSKPQIPKLEREWSKRVTRPDMVKTREQPIAEDEVSDMSGISQVSSTVTAATTEKGGEVLRRSTSSKSRRSEFNGEIKSPPPPQQKFRNNSFSDVVKDRNMTVHKSPSRRYDPSPPVRRSDPSPGRVRQNLGQRKDPGEISGGRRSNSPAMVVENGCGRTVLGRSLSGRKTGPSPGRVRSEQSGRFRKMGGDVTDREEKWPAAMQPPPAKESLENPLVSLECFIFL
ncbi:serine/arginine repetitive matrix protein 1-like [Impatiens glandulifera]|uniref:serine/arginine repetitive matrix protein 1-like n=1 Tax=Impatiens glandulifera TaxID=253017 RepID=UPI001FB0FFE8|nr:serine/arginine repetitive matrix protein 1-like [Impatiens glandulifera]